LTTVIRYKIAKLATVIDTVCIESGMLRTLSDPTKKYTHSFVVIEVTLLTFFLIHTTQCR